MDTNSTILICLVIIEGGAIIFWVNRIVKNKHNQENKMGTKHSGFTSHFSFKEFISSEIKAVVYLPLFIAPLAVLMVTAKYLGALFTSIGISETARRIAAPITSLLITAIFSYLIFKLYKLVTHNKAVKRD